MSSLIELESSIRHVGLLVVSRSSGPRNCVDHLKIRREACTKVLRRASHIVMREVNSNNLYDICNSRRRMHTRRNLGVHRVRPNGVTSWTHSRNRVTTLSVEARKKTIFVALQLRLSCGRFDGLSVQQYLKLLTSSGGTSQLER